MLKVTECASWFVANGLHVLPIAYKLRSPSDLIYGYPVTAGEDRLQPTDWLTVNFPNFLGHTVGSVGYICCSHILDCGFSSPVISCCSGISCFNAVVCLCMLVY